MNDRELLELAAKAAGISLRWAVNHASCWRITDAGCEYLWNPLADDGDALRLAVKLHLDINCYPKSKEVVAVQHRQNIGVYARSIERISDDPYAATRRAIVRAAAEIGKEIK